MMADNKSIFPPTSMAHEHPKPTPLTPEQRAAEDARYAEATKNSFFPDWSMAYDNDAKRGVISPKITDAAEVTKAAKTEVAESRSCENSASSVKFGGQGENGPIEQLLMSAKELFSGTDEHKSFGANIVPKAEVTKSQPLRNYGELAVLTSGKATDRTKPFTTMEPEQQLKLAGISDTFDMALSQLGKWTFSHDDKPILPAWCIVFSPVSMKAKHLVTAEDLNQLSDVSSLIGFRMRTDKFGKETVVGFHTDGQALPVVQAQLVEDKKQKTYQADLGNGLVVEWDGSQQQEGPIKNMTDFSNRIRVSDLQIHPENHPDYSVASMADSQLEEIIVAFPAKAMIDPLYLVIPKFKAETTVTIDPKNMYWPPYDFTKGEPVDVALESELENNHQKVVIFTLDDAAKSLKSMWDEKGTDTLKLMDKIRGFKDHGVAIYKSYEMVKQFGDLGVVAKVLENNGKEYISIAAKDNSGKALKHVLVNGTRLKLDGHKYRINNPKVIQLGLTPQSRAAAFKGSALVTFVISAAINSNDLIFKDDFHFVDWFGNVGVDMFKALVAFGTGEVAILIVASMVNMPIIIGVVVAVIASIAIDSIFDEWKVSEQVVEGLKNFE